MSQLASFCLAAVFGLVVFHAPLSVFFGQFFNPLLVKSWKEIILISMLPLVTAIVWRSGKLKQLSSNIILRLIVIYALLHILYLCMFGGELDQKLSGLAIDLRYVLFFSLVFCLASLRPGLKKLFLQVGTISASLSVFFAVLQAVLLPADILKHIGYSKNTIEPYLTVDRNSQFIRINGTLRGPNPLGTYAMILLSLTTAWVLRAHSFLRYKKTSLIGIAALLIVLWVSYSRSALLGAIISVSVVFIVRWARIIKLSQWLVFLGVFFCITLSVFIAKDSYFIQNVILHNNPSDNQSFNSNEGHAVSLTEGVKRFAEQPLGEGVGTTGSASLFSKKPLIIENQYLFVAHETGWLGLGLFAAVFVIILQKLYRNRQDWLSLGVFASGVALAGIALIQPVFVDDTVSLVWWGLAAIALASVKIGKHRENKPH